MTLRSLVITPIAAVATVLAPARSLTLEQARSLVERTGRLEFFERVCLARPCDGEGAHEDRPTGIGNADVVEALAGRDAVTVEPVVLFELSKRAAGRFATLTMRLYQSNITDRPGQLAIVLDGETLVAARVTSPILAGNGQIAGDFTEDEAAVVAAVIAAEPLPVRLRFVGVEPTS